MTITEVKDTRSQKQFLQAAVELNKDLPNWIRPLDRDIHSIFAPGENKTFRYGKAVRWIIKDDAGKPIGRIAAFVNKRTANRYKQPTGGIGFFECINNQQAANLLFDTAKEWLTNEGMAAMDGPVNFGERDKWWGLLVDGFDIEPNYNCNFNPPYYRELFENYGFREYFQQYTFRRTIADPLPEVIREKTNRIAKDPKYSFRHLTFREFEKFTNDFLHIYNKSWAKHEGVSELKKAHADAMFQKMKPVIDPRVIWYAYYDNEPVGFFIMLPELNQIFKKFNGKLGLWQKLQFLYHKWHRTNHKMFGVVFGIVPEHQGKGLEGAIIQHGGGFVQKNTHYTEFEMNWIGDFNPVMIKIGESIGAEIAKTHITYRYLFDKNAPFERHPVLK